MTTEEIFTKISAHMCEGIRFHDDMNQAFQFLALWGYAKEQECHYFEESEMYKKFQHYYMSHYFKLLPKEMEDRKELIPATWYKYSASAVDVGTKRSAIKDLMTKWIDWEKETKKLYEEMYLELTNLREIAAAIQVEKLIKDVDDELHKAQKELLDLEAIGFDLTLIIDWQDKIKKKCR